MVYPHSNSIGKEKPPSPSKLSVADMFNEEMKAIKSQVLGNMIDHMPMPVAAPKQYSKQQSIIDEMIYYINQGLINKKEIYNQLYGKKPEPKLVDGMDFSAKYDPNPKPVPYTIKTGELRFEVKGLFEKTHGVHCTVPVPPEGLTETELRDFLFKNFQSMTEKIISDVKKAKGIK